MKTSVVLHGDVLDHVEVERRPGTQKGSNCVRSGAEGGTHGARSDATRGATRKGSSAKAARTQGRRGASKGGGGLSHLDRGAFSANSTAGRTR